MPLYHKADVDPGYLSAGTLIFNMDLTKESLELYIVHWVREYTHRKSYVCKYYVCK